MKKEIYNQEILRLTTLCDSINTNPRNNINRDKAIDDFFYFASTYLSHYFTQKTAEFQRAIIKTIDSENQYIAIAAPRGFAKSTIVSFAYIIWSIIKKKYTFILIISSSDKIAENISFDIKKEIKNNLRLKIDFSIDILYGTRDDFVTTNNIRIISRGKRQSLRGLKHQENRPDLIILDDIEKDEEANSPITVKKTLLLILKSLIPSLSPQGKLILIGTIIQKNCCLDHIMKREYWTTLRLSALTMNDEGKAQSIWEERFSTHFLEEKKKTIGLLEFNTEYQNIASYGDDKVFKESMIKIGNIDNTQSILFIDPSTGTTKGDFMCCVMIRGDLSKIQVYDAIFIKASEQSFFTKIMDLYKKHKQTIISVGIESNGFQKYFINELIGFMHRNNIILPIQMVHNSIKKEVRIMKLLHFFETEKIYFDKNFINSIEGNILKEQLLYFPNKNVNDDGPDALSSGIQLLINMTNKNNESHKNNITQIPSLRKKYLFSHY